MPCKSPKKETLESPSTPQVLHINNTTQTFIHTQTIRHANTVCVCSKYPLPYHFRASQAIITISYLSKWSNRYTQRIHTHICGGQRLRFGGKPLSSAMGEMGCFSCNGKVEWIYLIQCVITFFFSPLGHVHKALLTMFFYTVNAISVSNSLRGIERQRKRQREIGGVNEMDI